MPLHVRRQAGPIDHDENLRQARQPLSRECGIEVEAIRFEMVVAQQSIHAFDAVAYGRCTWRAHGQGDEAERTTVDRGDHHIMQGAPARGVHEGQTTLHDLRYDGRCMHGTISLAASTPQGN